jgi:broad specificity phosphatase PhoE
VKLRLPPAVVTRWWWVRHAPVRGHDDKLYGQTDVEADVGERAGFDFLAERLPERAVWVTSHLKRTLQTAAAIAAAGLEVPEALIEPAFAEQHFGSWHGMSHAEIAAARDGAVHKFWIAPAHHAPPGGESFVDVIARTAAAIERLGRAHAGHDIVAVAHGGTIRAALQVALGTPPERALAFTIDNLSLTRIDQVEAPGEGGQWRVVAVNLAPQRARRRDRS